MASGRPNARRYKSTALRAGGEGKRGGEPSTRSSDRTAPKEWG
eukprot:CAMPEP_0182468120 /NCGR_PEP_ID=MMETSP1319-20130603/14998_1 /TAXON_ID=172717 /ORGANISM="Bolidomonas pacifica, Strain RCC208" /LENGTH=42 /DNA_ID= /DNA_START= /DNA_END= /DNA_ORIENTATION=